jgi:hypothetical protein
MQTAQDFRRMALALRDTTEKAHHGHPDFRAEGRIFASLHHSMERGMVKLTPDQQRDFMRAQPHAFTPEAGAWGRQGCTRVLFAHVDAESLGEALTTARRNIDRPAAKPRARRTRVTATTRKRRA